MREVDAGTGELRWSVIDYFAEEPEKKAYRKFAGTCYHASPKKFRESIKRFGLDPTKMPEERWSSGGEVYLFNNLSSVEWYANYFSNMDPAEPFDIWEITGIEESQLEIDVGLTSDGDEDEGSRVYQGVIEPSKLRLVKTVGTRFEASIIDYPRRTLDPQVWDLTGDLPMLNADVKTKIMGHFFEGLEKRYPGVQWNEFLGDMNITGSIGTYQWVGSSDVDVHVIVNDADKLNEEGERLGYV